MAAQHQFHVLILAFQICFDDFIEEISQLYGASKESGCFSYIKIIKGAIIIALFIPSEWKDRIFHKCKVGQVIIQNIFSVVPLMTIFMIRYDYY